MSPFQTTIYDPWREQCLTMAGPTAAAYNALLYLQLAKACRNDELRMQIFLEK